MYCLCGNLQVDESILCITLYILCTVYVVICRLMKVSSVCFVYCLCGNLQVEESILCITLYVLCTVYVVIFRLRPIWTGSRMLQASRSWCRVLRSLVKVSYSSPIKQLWDKPYVDLAFIFNSLKKKLDTSIFYYFSVDLSSVFCRFFFSDTSNFYYFNVDLAFVFGGFFLDTSNFYYFNVDLSFGFGGLFLDTFFYLF